MKQPRDSRTIPRWDTLCNSKLKGRVCFSTHIYRLNQKKSSRQKIPSNTRPFSSHQRITLNIPLEAKGRSRRTGGLAWQQGSDACPSPNRRERAPELRPLLPCAGKKSYFWPPHLKAYFKKAVFSRPYDFTSIRAWLLVVPIPS